MVSKKLIALEQQQRWRKLKKKLYILIVDEISVAIITETTTGNELKDAMGLILETEFSYKTKLTYFESSSCVNKIEQ